MNARQRVVKAYLKRNYYLTISILLLFLFPVSAVADSIQFSDPGDKTVTEGELLVFDLTAVATPASRAVTFTYSPPIDGANIGEVHRQGGTYTADFTWTPSIGQAGEYSVTYTACTPPGAGQAC